MRYSEALRLIKKTASEPVRPGDDLLDAIRAVESSDGRNLYGDWVPGSDRSNTANARAHGPYQLHNAYVEDVNRFEGTSYTPEDRLNEDTARQITTQYLTHYGNRRGVTPSNEVFARMHNGGPNGPRNPNPIPFWNRVPAHTTAPQAPAAAPSPVNYQVKAGDSLWSLWRQRKDRNTSWTSFQQNVNKLNPGINQSVLKPGQKLKLPPGWNTEPKAADPPQI